MTRNTQKTWTKSERSQQVGCTIMLTYSCPGQCAYCFADKPAISQSHAQLTYEQFEYYVKLARISNCRDFRLLGGEPLVHPEFEKMLKVLIDDPTVENITIFTSGLVPISTPELLVDPRVQVIVNVNHPNDYPAGQYEQLCINIFNWADIYINVAVGMNIYREDFDYLPFLDLANRIGSRSIRWTVAMPSSTQQNISLNMQAKRRIAGRVVEFLEACAKEWIKPLMDCPLEPCVFNNTELARFARICPWDVARLGKCRPIVDLHPGYLASRCLGTGRAMSVDVRDFDLLTDIYEYFLSTADAFKGYALHPECQTCINREREICEGGCMGSRINAIHIAQSVNKKREFFRKQFTDMRCSEDKMATLQWLDTIECSKIPYLLDTYAYELGRVHEFDKMKEYVESHWGHFISVRKPGTAWVMAQYCEITGKAAQAEGWRRITKRLNHITKLFYGNEENLQSENMMEV